MRTDGDGLRQFVETFAEAHPPLSLGAADLAIKDPGEVRGRYGDVFRYLTRVELEVERNVLELRALMPEPTETDRFFYEDVWSPQELRHGQLLDAVQNALELQPAPADLTRVGPKVRVVGFLAHLPGMSSVVRLLYYLTGAATERSAVIAYTRLLEGLRLMDEHALAETVVAPIRRQEPGHFAFYRRSAEMLLADGLTEWQLNLVRVLRRRSFELVGVNNDEQRAEFGEVARALRLDRDRVAVMSQVSLVERELLWARQQGMQIPDYILAALDRAICPATPGHRRDA
jgi:hypothetical protein